MNKTLNYDEMFIISFFRCQILKNYLDIRIYIYILYKIEGGCIYKKTMLYSYNIETS